MKPDKTKWFTDARFGMFIHWGIYSIPARGEWVKNNENISDENYEKFAAEFNPVDFDPDQWAEAAWNAGMRYVVFTTKHHDGFCMFDSDNNDFNIMNTPYGKDITAELVAAYRRKGIRIGFYHSLVDWRHPDFTPDAEHPIWKTGQRDFSDRDPAKYRKYLYRHVEQLLTNYGKIDILFFDYTSQHKTGEEWEPEKLLDMIYKLQPEILVNDRLSFWKPPFYGDYLTPEICLPNDPVEVDGKAYPWETCMTMNSNWGYCSAGKDFKSSATIIQALSSCVSKNGNLLLNVGPDAKGRIPAESLRILGEVGDWMKENSESVHGARMAPYQPPQGAYYTQNDEALFLHMPTAPVGDVILPELNGKIRDVRVLADGSEVKVVDFWGFELLKKSEIRIRPTGLFLNNPQPVVLKITLK